MVGVLKLIPLSEEQPLDGQKVWLIQGDIKIQAIYHRSESGHGFEWLKYPNERGVCLLTNPTHWSIIE